jgi:hypothetical protein
MSRGAVMERGLLVELSPHEGTALQRIAQGMVDTSDLQGHHIVRLKALALIEETEQGVRLTELGVWNSDCADRSNATVEQVVLRQRQRTKARLTSGRNVRWLAWPG